jgi:hypothetical protein
VRRQCGDRTALDGPQVNPGVREATAAFTAEGAAILDRVPVLAVSGQVPVLAVSGQVPVLAVSGQVPVLAVSGRQPGPAGPLNSRR